MPLYEYECPAGHRFELFLPLVRYNDPQRCACGLPGVKQMSAPFVHSDLPGYESPVTGRWIEGRAARREDLARTGSREWEPGLAQDARRRAEDTSLEIALSDTFDRELAALPAAKRERLASEMAAGTNLHIQRK